MHELSCGVDLVEIARFHMLSPAIRARFIKRVFTPSEEALCTNRDESLAGRFAAKEAVAKTLGCGIGLVHWQDIETLADENARPILHLHGRAQSLAAELGLTLWSISITHTKEMAMAFVVASSENSSSARDER